MPRARRFSSTDNAEAKDFSTHVIWVHRRFVLAIIPECDDKYEKLSLEADIRARESTSIAIHWLCRRAHSLSSREPFDSLIDMPLHMTGPKKEQDKPGMRLHPVH